MVAAELPRITAMYRVTPMYHYVCKHVILILSWENACFLLVGLASSFPTFVVVSYPYIHH